MRLRPWVQGSIAALIGAITMVALGQLFSFAGGSCTILCRPPIAALYGAAMGLLLMGKRPEHGGSMTATDEPFRGGTAHSDRGTEGSREEAHR